MTLDRYDIVVSKDGSGHFKTVQEAIDAVPEESTKETRIYIKQGIYKEKLRLNPGKNHIHFIGENAINTILTYDDFASRPGPDGQNVGTTGSSSMFIDGNDFTAENITFENSAGQVGQAVAANITGDRHIYRNCRFLGLQDTLYVKGTGRLYFDHCYIEGNVDFIFGASTAVFNQCRIFSTKLGAYVTAASTPQEHEFGYVFLDCELESDLPEASTYLGRPWRPFACAAYINCYLGAHIKPEGWDNWGKAENEGTARYAEYKSRGPGANPERRVQWSRQLTDEEAMKYTIENILGGTDGWDPRKV